nr:leucine-rich repeat domain-containing protein [Lachnospiraceae bacterium]
MNKIDEDTARCPHCETEFLIDEGQPENVIHIHEAEKKTPWGAVVAALVIMGIIAGFIAIALSGSGTDRPAVAPTVVEREVFQSSFFKEFVAQVYGTSCENVTAEQLKKLTYIHIYAQDGMECVRYRLEEGETETLFLSSDLRKDYIDLANFPNLKGIYLQYGSIPEGVLGVFSQLEELESENSPEELERKLPSPGKLKKYIIHRNYSMEGIHTFENLEYFETDYYDVKDIRAIVALKNLKTLIIKDGDEITDFGALCSLSKLEVLYLEAEQLKDISFVEGMEGLREFTLRDSVILDLSPLSGKTTLTYLELEDNYEVKDYSVLSSLTSLETLHLDLCSYGEMPEVSGWTSLTELSVSGANNLQFLAQLPTLKKLSLSGGDSSDFEVLAHLTELTELTIGRLYGDLRHLDSLVALTNLKKLDISGMTVYGNIEDVFAIPGLEELDVSDCSFGLDFDHIPENQSLKRLSMNRVSLWENIQVLQDGFVTYLDYDELSMADHISFVSRFPNLEELYLQGNKLTDVAFAEQLPMLKKLDVTDNYITDLRPLQSLTRLEIVWCGENSISQGVDLGQEVHVVLDSEAEEGAWWR